MTEETTYVAIQMSANEFIATVYAAVEESTVNSLIDNGADPNSIRVTLGTEPDTVDIKVVRRGDAKCLMSK